MVVIALVAHFADGVTRILVGRDEVHRRIMSLAVVHKSCNPFAVAGGGAAHFQLIVHGLDGFGCNLIQAEIFLLRAVKERRFQIRLVPDLKEPCFHFLFAIAVQQEANKFLNVRLPLGLVLRRGDAGLPVEAAAGRALGHLAGHKAQLHKGLHAGFQHIVIDQSRQAEAVLIKRHLFGAGHRHNGGHCIIGVHIIAENAVKTHTFNTQFVMDLLELFAVIGAHRHACMGAADAELPVLTERFCRCVSRNRELHRLIPPFSVCGVLQPLHAWRGVFLPNQSRGKSRTFPHSARWADSWRKHKWRYAWSLLPRSA